MTLVFLRSVYLTRDGFYADDEDDDDDGGNDRSLSDRPRGGWCVVEACGKLLVYSRVERGARATYPRRTRSTREGKKPYLNTMLFYAFFLDCC